MTRAAGVVVIAGTTAIAAGLIATVIFDAVPWVVAFVIASSVVSAGAVQAAFHSVAELEEKARVRRTALAESTANADAPDYQLTAAEPERRAHLARRSAPKRR